MLLVQAAHPKVLTAELQELEENLPKHYYRRTTMRKVIQRVLPDAF